MRVLVASLQQALTVKADDYLCVPAEMPIFTGAFYHQFMQTLTIQVHDRSAMKAIKTMEERHAISIVEQASSEMDSPALPGQALTLKAFKDWIASAEAAPSVPLKAAQAQWSKQRKQLQRLVTK